MRVLAIADSDSYVKWGAAVLQRMPADWHTGIVVIATPAAPSADQLAAALSGTRFAPEATPVRGLRELAALIAAERPDVVLFSVRGPVVRVLVREVLAASPVRPVFVSGLPGISIPATGKALYYRAQVDLMILHSKREVREFAALASAAGIRQDFALARLPFLQELSGQDAHREPGRDIVFAAQAKVPREREDRIRVLGWLAETARRTPSARVVVKLRAVRGEQQTHSEKYPYEDLLAELDEAPENLVVASGPMRAHLDTAAALVTISSTAAIEAAAEGVPVLVLDDFGIDAALINPVFEGSGLLGASSAMIAGEFRRPSASWLDDNYFHVTASEDWIPAIEALLRERSAGTLELRPQVRGTLGGNLRRVWDRKRALGHHDRTLSGALALAVGTPARFAVLAARRAARVRRGDPA